MIIFSFPGGKRDLEDSSLIETAIREMKEELPGLERSLIQVWAPMPAMPDRVISFKIIIIIYYFSYILG